MKKTLLSLPLLFLGTQLISQSVTNGLIAAYNFNTGKPYDQIAPKANGVEHNSGTTVDHFGNTGMSYVFNNTSGSGYYVDLSAATKANVTSGLTISSWVKLNPGTGERAIVSKWLSSQSQDQYILFINNSNQIQFAVGNPSVSASGITTSTALSSNTWHHVVATWDNTGKHSIYLNGVLETSSTLANVTSINSTSSLPLLVGVQSIGPVTRPMKGAIDDILLYNRALSLSEIQQIYNEPNPIVGGLVSHYHFDFPTNEIKDIINYNDGTGTGIFYGPDRNGNTNAALNIDPANTILNLHDTYDNFSANLAGQMAYSFWINFKSLNNAYQMIIAKSSDAGCSLNERQFLLRINAQNKLEVAGYNTLSAGNFQTATGSTTFTTGNWYHVVLNYNQNYTGINKFNMWVNGTQETLSLGAVNGTGFSSGWQDGPACIGIGAYLKDDGNMCANAQRLDAYFDDLKIYNKELTPTEIATLAGVATGISEASVTQNLLVFPNPANNVLNVDSKTEMNMSIINILGKTIQKQTLSIGSNQIDVSILTSGIYFIKAENGATIKFVKE